MKFGVTFFPEYIHLSYNAQCKVYGYTVVTINDQLHLVNCCVIVLD